MSRPDPNPAVDFVRVPTPDSWLASALQHLPELLIDHANCEKKAASTAMGLMYKYVDRSELLYKMSRLAREELRHFEQVMDLMAELEIKYTYLASARYAGELHKLVRHGEPERLIDVLVLGAVVEARSCERFVRLVEVLPDTIADLYRQLVHSEARHFKDYLELARDVARQHADDDESISIDDRIDVFLTRDAQLITSPDDQFRFHSGAPG